MPALMSSILPNFGLSFFLLSTSMTPIFFQNLDSKINQSRDLEEKTFFSRPLTPDDSLHVSRAIEEGFRLVTSTTTAAPSIRVSSPAAGSIPRVLQDLVHGSHLLELNVAGALTVP